MDDLKKENFDLKLKCYHLEDQLRKQTPANVEVVFKEVIDWWARMLSWIE